MTSGLAPPPVPELRSAVAECLIPLAAGDADDVVEAVGRSMWESGIEPEDQASHLVALLYEWREGGEPPAQLRDIYRLALSRSSDESVAGLASDYFDVHDFLTNLQMSPARASALISETSVIADLAVDHVMSASQIATVLSARGDGASVPWRGVQAILAAVGRRPQLADSAKTDILSADRDRNTRTFADDRWDDSLATVSETARSVGFRDDIRSMLSDLVPEDGEAHWPYVTVLHFSLVPLDRFDHHPAYLYEFKPRGRWVVNELVPEYESVLTAAENPVLNNFKSIDRLGPWWSDARSDPGARALVDLVLGLSILPPEAKKELAAVLRAWCLRQVSLFAPRTTAIPDPPDASQVARALSHVAAGNTQTRGVLEQRMVDAVSIYRHPPRERVRGAGDSVNAANLPRRKMGDIEFQDAQAQTVQAYEAHGGRLTKEYVNGHVKSLDRLIERRIDEEWGTPEGWSVSVTFVAHDASEVSTQHIELHGVPVTVNFVTYQSWFDGLDAKDLVGAVTEYVWKPICDPRTPESTRAEYAAATTLAGLAD